MRRLKFVRQLIAMYKVYRAPEYGGVILDFKNGKMEQIYKWQYDLGSVDEAAEICHSMNRGGRDEIYIVAVSCGRSRGYLMVEHTGKILPWIKAFWDDLYPAEEAMVDTMVRCRKQADKMGFRRPDAVEIWRKP